MTDLERAADADTAMARMFYIAAVRASPSKGVRRRGDKLPPDVRRNGTRWGFIPKEARIGPDGWGKPKVA